MRFIQLTQKSVASLKNKALLVFTSLMITSQGWASCSSSPFNPLAPINEITQTLANRLHRDIDVGYPLNQNPVPLNPDCLLTQEVFGTTTTIFYGSAVEPTIAVNPVNSRFIVTAWQQSRISNGGALEAGIAFSRNGGRTWHRTVVPFQLCIGGISQRVSDTWLSYSSDGTRLYLIALLVNVTTQPGTTLQGAIAVATSFNNGASWEPPTILESTQGTLNDPGAFIAQDKPSITANLNNPLFAYAVWDDFPDPLGLHSETVFSSTTNGGANWSIPRVIYNPFPDLLLHNLSNGNPNDNNTISNIIVVQPKKRSTLGSDKLNGDLLNFMVRAYAVPGATPDQYENDFSFPVQFTTADIAVIRSQDNGLTWDSFATVVAPYDVNSLVFTGGYTYGLFGEITGGLGTLLRTSTGILGEAISATVNPKNGNLYVVWQTGQFRADRLPQIALSTSRDGGRTWSAPVQVSRTPFNSANPQAFTPFVAVTEEGDVGILYSDFRYDSKLDPNNTLTDTWLAVYKEVDRPNGGETGIGLRFKKEVRLSGQSYIAQNGPVTGQGVMTNGDYSFLVARDNAFYAAYTKSFPGPFNPPIPILVDPVNDATILLDYNIRTAPFVSIIRKPFKNIFPFK